MATSKNLKYSAKTYRQNFAKCSKCHEKTPHFFWMYKNHININSISKHEKSSNKKFHAKEAKKKNEFDSIWLLILHCFHKIKVIPNKFHSMSNYNKLNFFKSRIILPVREFMAKIKNDSQSLSQACFNTSPFWLKNICSTTQVPTFFLPSFQQRLAIP